MSRMQAAGPSQAYLENLHRRLAEVLLWGKRAKYEQGRILDEIITGEYWCRDDYPGAPEGGYPHTKQGFASWCRDVIGYEARTIQYLRSNYVKLASLQLNEKGELFQRALEVGWWRLNHILRVATTEAALLHWLDRVKNERMDSDKLRGEVELALGGADEDDGPPPEEKAPAAPKKKQKAEAADADQVGDDQTIDPETGETLPGAPAVGADDNVRVDWNLRFENRVALRTWLKGLEVVKHRLNTTSNGQAAATMATYYLTHAPRDDEGGLVVELEELLQLIEATWGVRLAVVTDAAPSAVAAPPKRSSAQAALEGFAS